MKNNDQYTLFYDGDCPFCKVEMSNLRRKDRYQSMNFVDISQAGFNANEFDVSHENMMSRIHARKPDGTWDIGMDVLRTAYSNVGLGRWIRWTALPGITRLFDHAYAGFADHRVLLGNLLLKMRGK